MKTALRCLLTLLILMPAVSMGADFSLFGVKMGMSKEEVSKVWTILESGEYVIENSALFNIQPEFDHRDRLYKLTFSAPLGDQYPGHLVSTALQKLVQELWSVDRSLSVGTRSGRGMVEITITSKSLLDEYVTHIKAQLSALFQP